MTREVNTGDAAPGHLLFRGRGRDFWHELRVYISQNIHITGLFWIFPLQVWTNRWCHWYNYFVEDAWCHEIIPIVPPVLSSQPLTIPSLISSWKIIRWNNRWINIFKNWRVYVFCTPHRISCYKLSILCVSSRRFKDTCILCYWLAFVSKIHIPYSWKLYIGFPYGSYTKCKIPICISL